MYAVQVNGRWVSDVTNDGRTFHTTETGLRHRFTIATLGAFLTRFAAWFEEEGDEVLIDGI